MPGVNEPIRVLKLDLSGKVTWQYEGRVLSAPPHAVVLEAFFNRSDLPFLDTVFREHDRFVETFYTDRWYNVFEIHDRDTDALKGWYCNICRPAVLGGDGTVSYVDLALDLWVSPDGNQTVLDEDEFQSLPLEPDEQDQARTAMKELQKAFGSNRMPPES